MKSKVDKNVNFYRTLSSIALWALDTFPCPGARQQKSLITLISRLDSLVKTRGLSWTISIAKGTRQAYLAYLSGKPIKVTGIKQTSDGLPCILGDLIPAIRRLHIQGEGEIRLLAYVNTILFGTRALKLGQVPDFTSIIGAFNGSIPSDFSSYTVQFWKELGYKPSKSRYPKALEFKKFHESFKAGPNGPAMIASWKDFTALSPELLSQLSELGGPEIRRRFEVLSRAVNHPVFAKEHGVDGKDLLTTRKLVSFPDKELKQRVVALGDYWSQTVLRPWHSYLFRVLKKIPQDCTFDQVSFRKKVDFSKKIYSVDLSSATDRFPVELTTILLKGLLPSSKVDLWKSVLCDIPFWNERDKTKTERLHYSVGTPMGLYSSWASFAVTHHYVMYYLCKKNGINWHDIHYCILGDDVIIWNEVLGEAYLEFLKVIDVDYSPSKTFISHTLVEFTKCVFYRGHEISPIPVGGLLEGLRSGWYQLPEQFRILREKGWDTSNSTPADVLHLLKSYFRIGKRKLSNLEVRFQVLELITKVIKDPKQAGDLLTEISRWLGCPQLMSDQEALITLTETAISCLEQADQSLERRKSARPLGERATQLLILYTSELGDDYGFGNELVEVTPMLYSYGIMTEEYGQLRLDLKNMEYGSWNLNVTSWGLPYDDMRFTEGKDMTKARATNRFAKYLTQALVKAFGSGHDENHLQVRLPGAKAPR